MTVTKNQFESDYAARSQVSVDRLHELGQAAAPCDCGEPDCQGWQMTSIGAAAPHLGRSGADSDDA